MRIRFKIQSVNSLEDEEEEEENIVQMVQIE